MISIHRSGLFNAVSAIRLPELVRLPLIAIGATVYGAVNQIVPLKTRYILTSDNRLRLRYVALLAAGVSGFLMTGKSDPIHFDYTAQPASSESVAEIEPAAGRVLASEINADTRSERYAEAQTAALVQAGATRPARADGPVNVSVEVGQGDTFTSVLVDAGVAAGEARDVVEQVASHFNMKKLRAGQKLDLRLEPESAEGGLSVAKVSFVIDPIKTLHIERNNGGSMQSRIDELPVNGTRRAARVQIDGSLYGSAERANLPDTVTANAIKMFSYAVDFQRDIKQGDKLEVLYDSFETPTGYVAKTGDIVHARLVAGGREFSLYRYKNSDGQFDYYTQDGKSIRRSTGLMKTPIAFGRVSSGFGVRHHPVLGFTKMHKGIDFAAPVGTAIYAAADGKVEKAGRFSSYGNYVRIRHNAKLSTAYAHVSRFAPGLRPGSRVKQGQVIAYVGTTGRSTGPHLHFEVMMNNVQVNPRSAVQVAADNSLRGEDLKRFKAQVRGMDQEYVRKTTAVSVASSQARPSGNLE